MELKNFVFLIGFTCLIIQSAHAKTFNIESSNRNLISCETNLENGFLWGCSVAEKKLINIYPDVMDYTVKYRLSECGDRNLELGFKIGNTFVKAEKTSVQGSQTILNGKGNFSVAHTPYQDFPIFDTCYFTIQKITVTPSRATIDRWNEDALRQSNIIDKSLTIFQLASSLSEYVEWSRHKTKIMLDEVEKKILLFQTKCDANDSTACRTVSHFKVIANSLRTRLESAPDTPLDQIGDIEAQSLVNIYRLDLNNEIEKGKSMVKKFLLWEIEIQEDLALILEDINI